MIDRYENNYGQDTAYKSCVKDKWWTFWDGPSKNEECIKIEAEGYVMVTISRISATRENGIVQA